MIKKKKFPGKPVYRVEFDDDEVEVITQFIKRPDVIKNWSTKRFWDDNVPKMDPQMAAVIENHTALSVKKKAIKIRYGRK